LNEVILNVCSRTQLFDRQQDSIIVPQRVRRHTRHARIL